MKKTRERPTPKRAKGYVVGRNNFAKISAVEGIHLSPEMEARFLEFDRKGLSASERRKVLSRAFGGAR